MGDVVGYARAEGNLAETRQAATDVRGAPFALAIGLSAFLLFSLELLAGRLLLPVFGGAPQVWTTALAFFTAILLAGYAYADFAATRMSRRTAGTVQITLVLVALGLTALAPTDASVLRVAGLPESLNVVLALAILFGGAALLLATTTPLLSAWFAAAGRRPWWLYAVSNGASLAALLAYPLLIQPAVGLTTQRGLLVLGLAAYGALLILVAFSGRAGAASSLVGDAASGAKAGRAAEGLGRRRQLTWLLSASVPAGLLAATTNFVQTDLVSAPLIWIGPLAAYLASFVVAFSDRGRRAVVWANRLAPAVAMLLAVPFILPVGWPVVPLLMVEIGSLFVLALAIHGRLALDRPVEGHLTRFYLILSAGGVLGTAAVAIIAPLVLPSVYEYPLLVVAALAALSVLPNQLPRPARLLGDAVARVAPYAAVAALLTLLMPVEPAQLAVVAGGLLLVGGALVALSMRPPIATLSTAIFLALMVALTSTPPLHRERTFFGVVEVRADEEFHTFYSGTTIHGRQYLDARSSQPTTYYVPGGPVKQVFDRLHARTGSADVGVIGLGAGVLAAYARPGDEMTFIEIDPAVVRIASNPAYFTYLEAAPIAPRIIIGDGRLELAELPPASFDLLVADAFTSDAVPAHLLTAEALALYQRSLRPHGVVLLNLSNRYYDLVPPAAATARSVGLEMLVRTYQPSAAEVSDLSGLTARWAVVGPADALAEFAAAGWAEAPSGIVLTDDYSDLTRVLLAGFR